MNARVKRIKGAPLAFLGLLASLPSLSSLAHAQAWLPDRNYTEGPGIRAGNLEIHPGVVVRGGYDNNVFRTDGDTLPTEGSAILAVTPHVHLSTLSQQRLTQGEDRQSATSAPAKLAFRSGLSATYLKYFVDGGPHNLEIDSDFWVGVLPRRPINFEVAATYQRNVRPFTWRASPNGSKDYIYDYITPSLRLNFGSRSQVLTGYVSYVPRVSIYESTVFDYLNGVQHQIQGGAGWKFLPNTALVYDGQLDLTEFQKDFNETTSPVLYTDSKRFRTRIGINGALTKLLSLRVMGGYAVGFYDDARIDDFENMIAEVSLSQRFGTAASNVFTVGYLRDVQGSALGGWVLSDRGFANFSALLGQVVQINLEAGAAYLTYGRLVARPVAGQPEMGLGQNGDAFDRNDVRLDGAVRAEYRLTNWLALTGDFVVQALVTDFEYSSTLDGSAIPIPASYFAMGAFGGVRAHY